MLKVKPWWLSSTGKYTWVTIYPYIYYPKSIANPEQYLSTIKHEEVHLERQQTLGKYVWLFSYLTNKVFRFHEEALAMRVELKFTPEAQRYSRMVEQASQLSGQFYHNCTTYNEAIIELSKPLL